MKGAFERLGTITVGMPAPAKVGRPVKERTDVAVLPRVVVAELRVEDEAEVVDEEASSVVAAAAVVEAADCVLDVESLVVLLSSEDAVPLPVVVAALVVAASSPVVAAAVVVASFWAEARVSSARSKRSA